MATEETPAAARNETFKYLEDPLRLSGLTIGQYATLSGTTITAIERRDRVRPETSKPAHESAIQRRGLCQDAELLNLNSAAPLEIPVCFQRTTGRSE